MEAQFVINLFLATAIETKEKPQSACLFRIRAPGAEGGSPRKKDMSAIPRDGENRVPVKPVSLEVKGAGNPTGYLLPDRADNDSLRKIHTTDNERTEKDHHD